MLGLDLLSSLSLVRVLIEKVDCTRAGAKRTVSGSATRGAACWSARDGLGADERLARTRADSHMVVMGRELSFGPVRAVLCGRERSEGTVSRGNVCRQLQLVSPEFTQFLVDRGSTRVDYF